ncbi:MAG TPA: hypothetical protein VMY37_02335 [Thermoguttaceae bacterium]|nr:hypothetical protein [Thermoguttaceae bacterium]
MPYCDSSATGQDCTHCGWKWKYWPAPWPKHHCPALVTPEARAAREAELRPENIVARFATRCQTEGIPTAKLARCAECLHLSPAGCGLAAKSGAPCKQWQWLVAELQCSGECQRYSPPGLAE